MQGKFASFLIAGAIVFVGLPSQAQPNPDILESNALRSLLPTYTHYASAIQEHGLEGFKSITAPDFTIRHGAEHWTGAAAFTQTNKWLDGIQGGEVAITIRRVTITGKTAVALTQEVLTFRSVPDATWKGTGTWLWKQTWHRVGDEWKLASQEPISKQLLGPSPAIEYTVRR